MQTLNNNIFIQQIEFIDSDPRTVRPDWLAYSINPAFMFLRHNALLPAEILQNKSVLDLGSCNAATGAWCLSNGAKHYTGVEFQNEYVNQSKLNLTRYYPSSKWAILPASAESFLQTNQKQFDIIVALGIVHAFSNPISFLRKISRLAQIVVIDGTHPFTLDRSPYLSEKTRQDLINTDDYIKYIENEPFIGMHRTGMSLHAKKTVLYDGFVPSMGAINQILTKEGMIEVPGVNEALKQTIPTVYSPKIKFGLRFEKNHNAKQSSKFGLMDSFNIKGKLPVVDWSKK